MLLLIFLLITVSLTSDYRSGLYLRLENDVRHFDLTRGATTNITYWLLQRRGGTGLLGVRAPRLVFGVEGGEHLRQVPQSLDINLQEEEESCSASESGAKAAEEILVKLNLSLTAVSAGQVVISTAAEPPVIDTTTATITIDIVQSDLVQYLIHLIGWVYFVLWSISFYPQIILNFKRSSVQGLNMDFVILNVLGFGLYSVFNIEMFFNSSIQSEYLSLHPDGVLPVQLNDVVFSVHALLAASLTLAQCVLMKTEDQRISWQCSLFLGLQTILILTSLSLALAKVSNWLTFLYLLSYMKLFITLIKFVPQVMTNYRHKSTKGWSVGNILLDMSGGLASLLQMVLVADNSQDWTSLTGNLTKLGLSAVSLSFDLVFLLQHFVLYRNRDPYHQIQ